jgi:hypothetical protein
VTPQKDSNNNIIPRNIVAEWLILLLCIQQILGSNLNLGTDYPD